MPPTIPNPADRWQVPPALEAWGRSLQGRIPYVGASMLTSDNPDDAQLPVPEAVRELARWLVARFSLSSAGTRRGSSVRAPVRNAQGALRRRDVHEEGRAIDAMTTDIPKGTEIANLLVRVAPELGIQYVLWRGLEWGSGRSGAAWEVYTGRDPHTNHVHLEVTTSMATNVAAMRAALARLDTEIARAGGVPQFLASPLPGSPGGGGGGGGGAGGGGPLVPSTPGPVMGTVGTALAALAVLGGVGGAVWWLLRSRPRGTRGARGNPGRRPQRTTSRGSRRAWAFWE